MASRSSQPPRKRRKRVKMIARITSYDYNVLYDLGHKQECKRSMSSAGGVGLYAAPVHEEAYNVMEGEILMSLSKSRYKDGQIHCFSLANGLGGKIPPAVATELRGTNATKSDAARTVAKFMIMDQLNYVGIAVTGFDAMKNSYQDMQQGFVATFAGLNTIINTGKEAIRPGDWVTVNIPHDFKWDNDPFNRHKKAEGVPIDKLLFATEPYKPSTINAKFKKLNDALNEFGGIPDSYLPASLVTAKNNTEGDMKLEMLLAVDYQAKRLIIGKALSFARSGEPFDICLGNFPSF